MPASQPFAPVLLALLSAALYAASFPPLSVSLLAWVAWVPLLVALAGVPPALGFAIGGLWGLLAAFGVGWCLPEMVRRYFELGPAASWLVASGIYIAFGAVYFAALGGWISWLCAGGGASPLAIAAGFVTSELARSCFLVGSPWAIATYSQMANLRLIQVADATGPWGVLFLIAFANAAIAGLISQAYRGGSARPRRALVNCFGAAAAVLAALAYGQWRIREPRPHAEPIEIAIVQSAIVPRDRATPSGRGQSLALYVGLARAAIDQGAALVVLPEYAVDAYPEDNPPELSDLLDLSKHLRGGLIFGAPAYVRKERVMQQRNSVFLARNGLLAGRYDKTRLLPIAEGDPWPGWWPDRLRAAGGYAPGALLHSLRSGVGLIGPLICFEAMYPELARTQAGRGAELLVNLSNDSWFAGEAPAAHHLQIARLRAVENRRYLIRAASTGISAIVDPLGRVLAQSPYGAAATVRGVVAGSREITLYQRVGDLAAWIAVGSVVSISLLRGGPGIWSRFRRRSKQQVENRSPVESSS